VVPQHVMVVGLACAGFQLEHFAYDNETECQQSGASPERELLGRSTASRGNRCLDSHTGMPKYSHALFRRPEDAKALAIDGVGRRLEVNEPPSTAQEAARLVRNEWEPHVAMSSTQRIINAWEAVEATDGLLGDIVEVGVHKGGTSMVMAYSALHMARKHGSELSRSLWLFDTFEGLPKPGSEDGNRAWKRWQKIKANPTINTTARFQHGEGYVDDAGIIRWNYGPLNLVKSNVMSTGFPQHRLKFVQGKVEETLLVPAHLPKSISVLRLDTDFFLSTKIELSVLFPRLVKGGVLIVDDYCNWSGARRAVDLFLAQYRSMLDQVVTSGPLCFRAVKI